MKTDLIKAYLFFLPVVALQTTLVPFISIKGITPDIILILLIIYTLKLGQMPGTILGFSFGFFFDLVSGGLLGTSMFSKTIAGFVGGYFFSENKIDTFLNSFTFSGIILICSIFDSVLFTFFSSIDFTSNIFQIFFEEGLLPALYTALISLLITIFRSNKRFG